MNRKIIALALLLSFLLTGCQPLHSVEKKSEVENTTSPYIEITDRDIKALSEERIQALLDGAGAGYALSAELNSYPGPLHAIELTSELVLTEEQEENMQEIFNDMKKESQNIGKEIIELEYQLENAFRSTTITKADVVDMTNQISILDGKLRSVHLNAHIDTVSILTDDQIQLYNELRGYSSDNEHHIQNNSPGHE